MPGEDGRRLDDDEVRFANRSTPVTAMPRAPGPPSQDEPSRLRPLHPLQLMAEREDLEVERGT